MPMFVFRDPGGREIGRLTARNANRADERAQEALPELRQLAGYSIDEYPGWREAIRDIKREDDNE
jgi:hypothetical protein